MTIGTTAGKVRGKSRYFYIGDVRKTNLNDDSSRPDQVNSSYISGLPGMFPFICLLQMLVYRVLLYVADVSLYQQPTCHRHGSPVHTS